jgi:hypothetical protein
MIYKDELIDLCMNKDEKNHTYTPKNGGIRMILSDLYTSYGQP